MRHTFKAYERLKREQHIDTLFHSGKAFSVFPLRFIYLIRPRKEELSPVQIGFSIPKKKFRSSVDRHRVRRLVFEAWRLHKHLLYDLIPADQQMHLFIIFTDTAEPDYETVQKNVIKGIEKLKPIVATPPAETGSAEAHA